jgi:DUF4097 and DUF4098 domain-containing protein YvlB
MNRSLRLAFGPVALFAMLASPAAAQQETEQVDRTIAFAPGGTLRLKNFSGDVRITGTDAAEVAIHAVRRAPRERLNRIRLTIESSAGVVTINANDREDTWRERENDNVVATEFEIRVPRQTDLDVTAFSSPVTVEDVAGRHEVHTFSGNVQLTNVSGPVRAKTFSGGIRLDTPAWQPDHDLELDTFSGNVDVRLPAQAAADVRFESFSGDISSDIPLTVRRQSRRSLHATLNGGGGDVRVKTFSGDVRLAR